ncbi:MAG: protein kinase domain-containing protein [Candidatus Woesearchaeota archaeon]
MSVHAGAILAGRYRLEEVVGHGGMSTVYRATDKVLGRTVAVKVLLAALAEQDPTYAIRFEREARAAAALDNRSVVTVYDTGTDEGSHYIVMEFISGRSLEQILRSGKPLAVPEATRIAAAVAGALASAHAAGILHRDIKPANVMVADDGSVKVLDFGIARSQDGTAITQVASVVGTAAYMAPERALGQPGDARADIYSLGCVLYAMLTGAPPFSGEISAALLHQQINAVPRYPSALRAGIPRALDALVLAMLAKTPDQRPGSATEVRDDLLGLSGAPPTEATTRMPPRPAPLPPPPAPTAARGLAHDHRRRAIVMALLTALITLIAVALLSGGGPSNNGSARGSAGTTGSAPTTTRSATTTPSKTRTTATQPQPAPPGPTEAPPGHGGQPPGQAKKDQPGAGPGGH